MDATKNTKLENTILYLLKRSAENRPPLTVLLKMLWFVDYTHYSEHLSSVTGAPYVAMKRGPAIDGYKALFDGMEGGGKLSQDKEANERYPDSPTQIYSAMATPDMSVFSESEIDVMETVIRECAHKTGKALSERTHGSREPWTMVWDEFQAPKPIPEVLWRWSDNLPDETELMLASADVTRPHVQAALAKLRSAESAAAKTA